MTPIVIFKTKSYHVPFHALSTFAAKEDLVDVIALSAADFAKPVLLKVKLLR